MSYRPPRAARQPPVGPIASVATRMRAAPASSAPCSRGRIYASSCAGSSGSFRSLRLRRMRGADAQARNTKKKGAAPLPHLWRGWADTHVQPDRPLLHHLGLARGCMRRDCEWVVPHAAIYGHVGATPCLLCRSHHMFFFCPGLCYCAMTAAAPRPPRTSTQPVLRGSRPFCFDSPGRNCISYVSHACSTPKNSL